jgi:GNAT superfamily N-acetyltransferase
MNVSVRRVDRDDDDALKRVIDLGRKNAKYLGFMPKGGYEDRLRKGTLLIAVDGDDVLGYVLYDLPRSVIHIAHICVRPSARRNGVARALVKELSLRHGDRRGIELMVRNDFPAFEMWFRLGFTPKAEVIGRGQAGLLKTLMWLDHGQPDLFSWAEAPSVALAAVVDASAFYDLHPAKGRHTHPATSDVANAIAGGELEIVVVPELEREISRHSRPEERQRLRSAIAAHRTVAIADARIASLAAALTSQARDGGRVLTDNDEADLRYLAAASLAGLEAVLTKDESFARWATDLAQPLGIQLLDPRAAIIKIDEIARSAAYSPRALHGTALTLRKVRSSDLPGLSQAFLNTAARERRAAFKQRLGAVLARPDRDCMIATIEGVPAALWSTYVDNHDLIVDLLRVSPNSPLTQSLAEQLVFMVRDQARRAGVSRLMISDAATSSGCQRRMERDGFARTPIGLAAATPAKCQTRAEWSRDLSESSESRGSAQLTSAIDVCRQDRAPTAAEASEFERLLWPAKMTDCELPTYLIPIKQLWSSELFGVPAALGARSTVLGLSREHIYYRAPRPAVLTAPARVLWYLTQGTNEPIGPGVFACSRLEEVVLDSPEVLFARFQHLGVYERANIDSAAKQGVAQAVRVADTEIFDTSVTLDRLRALANRTCQTLHLRSPQRLNPALFEAIYREGALRHGRG